MLPLVLESMCSACGACAATEYHAVDKGCAGAKPTRTARASETMLAHSTAGEELLVANDRGRRHTYGPANGQEEVFRPLRRRLEPARTGADQGTAEGKRYVGEPRGQDLLRPERRHIPQAAERSGYDIPEQTLNWTKRGRVMWDSGPAQHWVSTERTLETECGMKIKPHTLHDKVRGAWRRFCRAPAGGGL